MCAPPLRLLCKVAQASLRSRHREGSYAWAGGDGGLDAACGIARVAGAAVEVLESSAASRDAPRNALVELCARCALRAPPPPRGWQMAEVRAVAPIVGVLG